MTDTEMFDSAIRSAGDMAGVFEYDGETGYFYLYETEGGEGQKIISSIQVLAGRPDFGELDIAVCWDVNEVVVGLFIYKTLWAAFDARNCEKFGGNYRSGGQSNIPLDISGAFDPPGRSW
jgi:hypothetical protein